MYANLLVEVTPITGGVTESLHAWSIETAVNGQMLMVSLDANDGESSYAVENGHRSINLRRFTVRISADF